MKALIVDDAPATADAVAKILAGAGMEIVATAATEDGALEACSRHAIDFAVVDLQLAQGTGFGVIRCLRERGRGPCCIAVITNHAVPALKVACYEAGADYFLDKARDFATLARLATEIVTKVA